MTGLDALPDQFWIDMKCVMYCDPHDVKAIVVLCAWHGTGAPSHLTYAL